MAIRFVSVPQLSTDPEEPYRVKFQCLCCAADQARPFIEGAADYFVATGIRVNYVQCQGCGLVQQNPIPDDVAPFYTAYPVHASKSRLHEKARRILLAHTYLDLETVKAGDRVLDYGCGDGWFLGRLSQRTVSAYGFEPGKEQARRVSGQTGCRVYADPRVMTQELAGQLDGITMHFVLEHLTDLEGTLGRLAGLLKPGGYVRSVSPQLDNAEFRWFGERWHGFDAPRHISFPTGHQLKPILDRVGLELERSTYVAFPNTLAASLSIALAGRYVHPLFLAFLPLATAWAWCYPKGAQCLWLRRRS